VNIQTDTGTITQTSLPTLPASGQLAFITAQQLPATAGHRGLAEFFVSSGSIAISSFRTNPTLALTSSPVILASGPPIIGGSPAPKSLLGRTFVVDGTMNISGQDVTIEIQAAPTGGNSYTLLFSQLAPMFPVTVVFSLTNVAPSGSDNTMTFTGTTTGGLYTNLGILSPVSSATLTLTVSDVTKGSSATGDLTIVTSIGSIHGTIAGTLTAIQ
jgi:hypothetical protein